MSDDNKNLGLAIGLSLIVLLAWQYFVGVPQSEKQRQAAQQAQLSQTQPAPAAQGTPQGAPQPAAQPGQPPVPASGATPPGATTTPAVDRAAALAASPRVAIETGRLRGSVNLRGGRIDDLSLLNYHETVDPKSPNIVLLSPSGSEHPFYAEFGWVGPANGAIPLPGPTTDWTPVTSGPLTEAQPLVLTWDNGKGLVFRRTIAVDDRYMFTVTDQVQNRGGEPVSLYNYGLISRHGTPPTSGFYILHEGLIGVFGDDGLQEVTYSSIAGESPKTWKSTGGWLGITDKYWAATLIPDQASPVQSRFSAGQLGALKTYQTDFLSDSVTVAPGATAEVVGRLFAGAKEVQVVDGYEVNLGIKRFELLIDWGWFYFITKPLFYALDFFYKMVGNFGLAILIVTVFIKIIFFPLANKSYASLAKMKAVQPQLLAIKERYGDDKMKLQQAMLELYRKEKINPLAGCWPVLIQIPVFFALYKVLFVTIEMRHAPFYGWIHDLAAPDPTTIFNLFGLIPWAPPAFLMLGAWPIIMGVTMWVQMKMNPPPPDPTQQMIFAWMPVLFTFMLASFPAGLVIYWTWNNFLSLAQQYVIMRKHGVKVELWDNLKKSVKKPASDKKKPASS
ncbi:membrane protein insertase YidC [Blastochloris tepida]|uniref:Membrane protein insertase YidC n=1 Tax=Blastochloris tepida TaxID=2233851 RepID=A0A348G406_9HYPH|nr:membrane protein insertase YidC [Blastochloris tepida]BBF94289.1 membrane protein insertase YidC [Blastochloris tepida]